VGLIRTIRAEGARDILRAFDRLPADAQETVRTRSYELARRLAQLVAAAGRADSRQSAVAAGSVQAEPGRTPMITAGRTGSQKARDLLFGSEFGMRRKTGWYRKPRYFDSRGQQFRDHLGAHSYWFFDSVERNQDETTRAYGEMADEIIQKWAR
jgi:hypothetical protein